MVSQPGWIHLLIFHDNDRPGAGNAVPAQYFSDDWLFLNDEGLVEEGVSMIKDTNGNIIQIAIHQGGVTKNLTYDMEFAYQPYPIQFDFGFISRMEFDSPLPMYVTYIEGVLEDKLVDIYTVEEVYAPPIKFEEYDPLIARITQSLTLDQASGAVLLSERTFTADNGDRLVVERATYTTVEKLDALPNEIAVYLNGN